MKISKSGLCYKLAYNWRPWCDERPDKGLNLCILMRRMLFTAFVMWPFATLAIPFVAILFIGSCLMASVIAGILGYRLDVDFIKNPSNETWFVPINSFLKKYKPIYLLILGWVVYSFYGIHRLDSLYPKSKIIKLDVLQTFELFTDLMVSLMIVAGVLTLIIFAMKPAAIPSAMFAGRCVKRASLAIKEATLVASEYLKARKEKLCPMVEVE